MTGRVTLVGGGDGTVLSSGGELECGARCVVELDRGSPLHLSVSLGARGHFVGWSGGTCSGTGPCTVTGAATVVATFAYDCTSTVIDNQAAAGVVALDGPYVYWTSFADDAIKRAPRGGGGRRVRVG